MRNLLKAGIVLEPKQLLASAAARSCDHEGGPTEIGFGGARGGGKSHWLMSQVGADDCQRLPGLKALHLRKVGKANIEQVEDLRRKVLKNVPHEFVAHRGLLKFPNGSRIILGHYQNESDIDAYLGLEYDVVGIEEATTLAERKYRDIKTCLRSSKNWRPRLYAPTNPGGIGHAWYKRRFILPHRKGEQTETRFIQSLAGDNRHLNSDYHRVLAGLKGWQREAWLLGSWDLPLGQYFSKFREEVHVIDDFDDTLGRNWACGFDYGWSHYTCVYLGCTDGDGNWYVVDCHRGRQMLPQTHAPLIKAMVERHQMQTPRGPRPLHLDDLARFVAGADVFSKQPDGTTIAQQYRRCGIKLTCANTDRIHGWAEILGRMGDPSAGVPAKLFIHRRCAALIESLPNLQHDPNRPEDVLKVDCDEEGNGGDDDADAFRYLLVSKAREVFTRKLSGF